MAKIWCYLKQGSTWEGVATALLTIAVTTGDIATGGVVTAALTAVGAVASATSILRNDDKAKEPEHPYISRE